MALVGESCFRRSLGQGRSVPHHAARQLHAALDEVGVRRQPGRLGEGAQELKAAQSRSGNKLSWQSRL